MSCLVAYVRSLSFVGVVDVEGQQLSEFEVYVVVEAHDNRNIIALEAISYLDEFQTVMFRALRVHKVISPTSAG